MDVKYLLLRFLYFLLIVPFAASQVPTPTPVTSHTALTVTEELWPDAVSTFVYTDGSTTTTITYDLAVGVSTTITASGAAATYTGDTGYYYGLQRHDVSIVPAYNISLMGILEEPLCYFPTSGTWSLLPRIVFYITLVFALIARKHKWLIGGALAAALAYSSLAALQISFQVWTKKALAELDLLAMTGILSASCVMAVPLMNWSSTIQRLGLDEEFEPEVPEDEHVKQDFNKSKDYGSARVVLVFWNLIVVVGFLSAFAGILAVLKSANWISFAVALDTGTINCVPPNGSLDLTAGQLPGWGSFWLTSEFVDQNNCVDPCTSIPFTWTLFRSTSELQLFSMHDIDHFFETTHLSRTAQRNIQFVDDYYNYLLFLLPFIILQGVMHILLFWRSSPQKARWQIYRWMLGLRKLKLDADKPKAYVSFAFWTALLFYIFAMFVLLIAPAAFIISIVATELALYWTPQSETNAHVDQWGPMAITILVLLAALISRVAPGARRSIKVVQLERKLQYYDLRLQYLNNYSTKSSFPEPKLHELTWIDRIAILWTRVFEALNSDPGSLVRSVKYHVTDFWLMLRYEWVLTRQFWNTPYTKPIRREKEPSRKWKHQLPQSKDQAHRAQVLLIKQRKKEVKAAKRSVQELERGGVHEKSLHAPFPSTASSLHQAYRDVEEALLVAGNNRTDADPEQGFEVQPESTPLLPSIASNRSRSRAVSNVSAEEMHARSLALYGIQEPARIHITRRPVRIVQQHSSHSAIQVTQSPAAVATSSQDDARATSPAPSAISYYSDQPQDTSYAPVSEVNSLRRPQTSASSVRADQRQRNDSHTEVIHADNTLHTNTANDHIQHADIPYNDGVFTDIPSDYILHNDTPQANTLLPNESHSDIPQTSTPYNRHQQSQPGRVANSKKASADHEDQNSGLADQLSQRQSRSQSLRSEHDLQSHNSRSPSPASSAHQRVSILHELPPIEVDSSFAFHFDAGH